MWNWIYNFLFVCQKTGEVSHTHFWSQIGHAVMVYTFVYAVMYGSEIDYELWLLFGVVIIGNRTLNKVFSAKGDK
jgi:hypothetical protein